jgi:hypothetical protein
VQVSPLLNESLCKSLGELLDLFLPVSTHPPAEQADSEAAQSQERAEGTEVEQREQKEAEAASKKKTRYSSRKRDSKRRRGMQKRNRLVSSRIARGQEKTLLKGILFVVRSVVGVLLSPG